jgi:hypothetical protein
MPKSFRSPDHLCGNCGAKIPSGRKICLKCGKRERVKEFGAGRKLAQCPPTQLQSVRRPCSSTGKTLKTGTRRTFPHRSCDLGEVICPPAFVPRLMRLSPFFVPFLVNQRLDAVELRCWQKELPPALLNRVPAGLALRTERRYGERANPMRRCKTLQIDKSGGAEHNPLFRATQFCPAFRSLRHRAINRHGWAG